MESTIICFFTDDSEKYINMAIRAITSFLIHTPLARVGLFTLSTISRDVVLRHIPSNHINRIICRNASKTPHFQSWNPTQYKLDIEEFADSFNNVYWMDADVLIVGDMTPFLDNFATSDYLLYFVADHVMQDPAFLSRWINSGLPRCTIPQACLMGFKSDMIHEFMVKWKEFWNRWISPTPFANYANPNPEFRGSTFCCEQYALGMALHSFCVSLGRKESDVALFFERKIFDLVKRVSTDREKSVETIPLSSADAIGLAQLGREDDESECQTISSPASDLEPSLSQLSIHDIEQHAELRQVEKHLHDSCVGNPSLSCGVACSYSGSPHHHLPVDVFGESVVHLYGSHYDGAVDALKELSKQ